jgi:hypothetical protein
LSLILILTIGLLSTSPSNGTTELNAIVNTRLLYNSCLQQDTNSTDTVDTVSSFIDNELGGWPLLQNSSWSNSAFNFTQLLIKQNVYNSYALFATSTQPEDMNSTVQNIQVRSNICENLCIKDFDILDWSR